MRIALPTEDNETIFPHFGRTPKFIIIDTETGESKTINNNHDEKFPATKLAEEKVNIVITNSLGNGAIAMLKNYNIKVLKAKYKRIKDNIEHLDELKEPTKGCPGGHYKEQINKKEK